MALAGPEGRESGYLPERAIFKKLFVLTRGSSSGATVHVTVSSSGSGLADVILGLVFISSGSSKCGSHGADMGV